MSTISNLQKARAAYQPKLPKALQGPVKVVEGAATESVGNQAEIKELFPNTYGMPVVEFAEGGQPSSAEFNVGSQDILRERFTISFSNRAEVEDVLKDIETVSRVRFLKVQEGDWEIFRE